MTGARAPLTPALSPVEGEREQKTLSPTWGRGLGEGVARLAAVLSIGLSLIVSTPAHAQKHGGVLHIEHIDSPPSASIHEEGTASVVIPFMAIYNNLVMYDQHVAQNSRQLDRAGTGDALGVGRGRHRADLHVARRGKMARRRDVHRGRREMHLGHGLRPRAGKDAAQSAPGLVQQPRRDHRRRRHRGDVPSETTAAGAARPARLGLVAGLSVPRPVGGDAHQADRHRPVQVRRATAERQHPAGAQSRLLEAGPALSRRDRLQDHPEPLDADARLHCRQVRHDLPDRCVGAAAEGHPLAGARGAMRDAADRRQHQPHHQPRLAAVRQSRHPPRAGADVGPQIVQRHHQRGPGPHRRCDAAAARGRVGNAARSAAARCPAMAAKWSRIASRPAR